MSVTYEMMVDWDATNWLDTPDFSEDIDDITGYVKTYRTNRGKDKELGNCPAGILSLTLNNADKRFSPPYSSSPLYEKMRPWLPVRLRATINGDTQTVYTGFISRISVNPSIKKREAYLYCTDGTDLLARNMVTQDKNTRTAITDGGAIGRILDATGWPSSKRSIDEEGGNIVECPSTTEF